MKTVAKITVPLVAVVATGVGIYTVIARLSDKTLAVLLGGGGVLVVVLVVGILFILKDFAQAYILRRAVAEDDKADIRQMALLANLLRAGPGSSTINLLPPGQQTPHEEMGRYRDVTSEVIEIE